jgi:hypothetical protein
MDDMADYAFVITHKLVQALIVLVEAQKDWHEGLHTTFEPPEMGECSLQECEAAVTVRDWLREMGALSA